MASTFVQDNTITQLVSSNIAAMMLQLLGLPTLLLSTR